MTPHRTRPVVALLAWACKCIERTRLVWNPFAIDNIFASMLSQIHIRLIAPFAGCNQSDHRGTDLCCWGWSQPCGCGGRSEKAGAGATSVYGRWVHQATACWLYGAGWLLQYGSCRTQRQQDHSTLLQQRKTSEAFMIMTANA